jgi:SAM-dependent methyltransferase
MKTETFPAEVAEKYDLVMSYFDYVKVADVVDGIVTNHFGPIYRPSVLELGIGTGSLALELITLGYPVDGIDHSSEMLARALEKGLPQEILHRADVSDFLLDRRYNLVISNAGPMRLGHTSRRGYFFETYLNDEQEVESALRNISDHMKSRGLFLMSVQTSPERSQETSSTPACIQLDGDYEAIKTVKENGNLRIKRREIRKNGQVITKIEHRFLMLGMGRFNDLARSYGLNNRGLDETKHYQIYERE